MEPMSHFGVKKLVRELIIIKNPKKPAVTNNIPIPSSNKAGIG